MGNLKPVLVSIGVNFSYITNRDELMPNPDEGLQPSTAALHWCMSACSVNRIFCEDDLKEFLFRLPIVLDALDVLQNWFAYDELFIYKVGEERYVFSVHDIFQHYGIEICDATENYASRDRFLDVELRSKVVHSTKLVGQFGGIEVLPLNDSKSLNDDVMTINLSHDFQEVSLSDKQAADARFFESDVMKLAPVTLYNDQGRFKKKLEEIELRKRQIASIPEFSLELIPKETRRKCMALMFDPEWVESCQGQNDEDYIDEEKRFVYLAWLFANDLIVADSTGWLSEAEGVELNLDDYELEDGGTNLQVTYDIYNILDVESLLQGVLFND